MIDEIAAEAAEQWFSLYATVGDKLKANSQLMTIIKSACEKVQREELAACRAATYDQICDLQDRAAHASEPPKCDEIAATAAKELLNIAAYTPYSSKELARTTAIIKSAIGRAKDEWNEADYIANNDPSYRAAHASEQAWSNGWVEGSNYQLTIHSAHARERKNCPHCHKGPVFPDTHYCVVCGKEVHYERIAPAHASKPQ